MLVSSVHADENQFGLVQPRSFTTGAMAQVVRPDEA